MSDTSENANYDTCPYPPEGIKRVQATMNEDFPQVDGYRTGVEIGHGGMGVVYSAEQLGPVYRRVAMKVIRPEVNSKEVISRFEFEKQTLALMDHPNIAKIYAAGLTEKESRPYLVMELVIGTPITDYCDSKNLPLRDRLALLIQVCRAVQHAHQRGIIHRDLKPSNILVCSVDNEPVVKIIDFGLATTIYLPLTISSHSQRETVGTIRYMSPEQIDSDPLSVDIRADIYSLGVVLYELLVGSTPLEREQVNGEVDQALQAIREVEPPTPSERLATREDIAVIAARRTIAPRRLRKMLTGDLDAIAMKAIDKLPDRRYSTVTELVIDIQRFFNDEAVEARLPSLDYQIKKFLWRNLNYVITVASVVVLMFAWSVWLIHTNNRITSESAAKEHALRETQKVNDFLLENFLAAARPQGLGGIGPEASILSVIQKVSNNIDVDSPLIEAKIRHGIGWTFREVGDPKSALVQMGIALRIRSELLGDLDDETLECSCAKGVILSDLGEWESAIQVLDKARTKRADKRGAEHDSVLSTSDCLAWAYIGAGKHLDAVSLLEPTLAIRRNKRGSDDIATIRTANVLAYAKTSLGNAQQAINLCNEYLPIARRSLGEEHPDTVAIIETNAVALKHLNHMSESLEKFREVAEYRIKTFGRESPLAAESLLQIAEVLVQSNDSEEAARRAHECITVFAIHRPDDWRRFWALAIEGQALQLQGKHAEARVLLDAGNEGLEQRKSQLPANTKHVLEKARAWQSAAKTPTPL